MKPVFKDCFDPLVLLVVRRDRFSCLRPLFLGGFKLAGQLNVNLVRFAVPVTDSIDHIYHLVENLFHNRIPEGVLRYLIKAILKNLVVNLFLRQGLLGMIVAGADAGDTIFIAIHHVRKNIPHRLVAQGSVILFEGYRRYYLCKILRHSAEFTDLPDQTLISRLRVIPFV